MKDMLFLAQSDTTAGFLSTSKERIIEAKQSDKNKPILREVSSLEAIKAHSRIPRIFGKQIRAQNKTTFIFQNKQSFRVVRDEAHLQFLKKMKILYSSSANISKQRFCLDFARKKADTIIIDKRGIFESTPSRILQANRRNIRKIR